jgi:hypothetical protein
MTNAGYENQKPFLDISHIRTFSASEGRSVELSKIMEDARQKAIGLRYSALEENKQKTERDLLVFLSELGDDSDYNGDFLKPSESATNATRNILLQAYRSLTDFSLLPKFITADGDGGIRLQWKNEARELRLICSEVAEFNLYWQDGEKYSLEKPTLQNLIARLKWLKEA